MPKPDHYRYAPLCKFCIHFKRVKYKLKIKKTCARHDFVMMTWAAETKTCNDYIEDRTRE